MLSRAGRQVGRNNMMVAVGFAQKHPTVARGWRRLSLPVLILFVLGVLFAHMLVLLSIATKDPHSTSLGNPNENDALARHSFATSASFDNQKSNRKTDLFPTQSYPQRRTTDSENSLKTNTPGKLRSPEQGAFRGENNNKPQAIAPSDAQMIAANDGGKGYHPDPSHVLKAFLEPIDFKDWEPKPLPNRSTATADQLEEISFPRLNSCSKIPEMIPADQYPDHDPFLPWIHDVFPTHDGKFIQFVAQNRRRCHTGTTESEKKLLHLTQPNIALFQHVPIKRLKTADGNETRYRLSSHAQADPDGIATRFICRFKPSMQETLSVYNFDYDYAEHRKRVKHTFQYNDGGILSVRLSQFIFRCPVPANLVDVVKSGESVKNDWATIFVDLVPVRTPPRYGLANEFLQPRYSDRLPDKAEDRFDAHVEWGSDHVLPRIKDSGRWENIPVCQPSLKAYYPSNDTVEQPAKRIDASNEIDGDEKSPTKHRLVACMWASAGYSTRGNRFAINDGQRRMLEWIHFNKLLGFEHFYLYDNSYAFSDKVTLKPIADMFPDEITYIKWPFQVCNNNPNNVDSPGERSSQYAAESSCRLRFGPHVQWIGQFDIDEYIIPMDHYTSILPILDKLDSEGKKILSFGSWRAWPKRDYIEDPIPIKGSRLCGDSRECFELQVPMNRTVLQTYNCDRQSGVMPAEKQLYRPDYVLQHFVHYSSVTVTSDMNRSEFEKAGYDWFKTKAFPDPLSRYAEESEACMLHTKAVARQDTAGWLDICTLSSASTGKAKKKETCRIGVPFPIDYDRKSHGVADEKGWKYNCNENLRTEKYWVPRLEKALQEHKHLLSFG